MNDEDKELIRDFTEALHRVADAMEKLLEREDDIDLGTSANDEPA